MELKQLKGAITSEDVLGKDVIDSHGEFIGVTDKLYLNPQSMEVLGLSVDKGFLQTGYVISTAYIKEIARHAVFLTIRPAYKIKGMSVFDYNGKKVGTVTDVQLEEDTNTVHSITVKVSFSKTITFTSADIASIGNNILLKAPLAQLLSSQEQRAK